MVKKKECLVISKRSLLLQVNFVLMQRTLPQIGIKIYLFGKVVGLVNDNFKVEVINFDHCPTKSGKN